MRVPLRWKAYGVWFAVVGLTLSTAMSIYLFTPFPIGKWVLVGIPTLSLVLAYVMVHIFVECAYDEYYPSHRLSHLHHHEIDRDRGFREAIRCGREWLPYTNLVGWLWLAFWYVMRFVVARGWEELERSNNVIDIHNYKSRKSRSN